MEISDHTGESFWYEIRNQSDGSIVMDGTAEIDTDSHTAHLLYGKIRFVLSEDKRELAFFAQGTEWENLSGTYTISDQDDPYGSTEKGDLIALREGSSEEGRGDLMTIHTQEDASAYLLEKLIASGYDTQGTALILEPENGDDDWFIGKRDVWYFAWGKNTPEKFTAEKHFAVTYDWEFWEYDVLNDTWSNMDSED